MKENEIISQLNKTIDKCVPDAYSQIMKKCERKEGYFMNKNIFKFASVVVAAIIIVVGVLLFSNYKKNDGVSIINIDVNPSITLNVNKEEKITSAVANNADAKKVLEGMNLKDTELNVAVNAIIGSMVKNGYIDELENSILISVQNKDTDKGAELEKRLTDEVNKVLDENKIKGSILSQKIEDDNLEKIANDNEITVGKALLINKIIENNSLLKFEDLAKLSIHELNVLLNENTNVNKTGEVSLKKYITEEEAKNAAFTHANVTNPKNVKVSFDYEEGFLVYEVEFTSGNVEYEYEINTANGDVVKYELDQLDEKEIVEHTKEEKNIPADKTKIGYQKAKEIALNHAKVTNVTNYKIELDDDYKYEIEFNVGEKEYEYEINAYTGAILKTEIDID